MDQPEASEHPGGPTREGRAKPIDLTPDASASALESLPNEHVATHPFGATLGPVLVEICGGRLTDLRWFRTDWQRGGALTGYCTWTDDAGTPRDAVVKMPVNPAERRWLVQLSADEVTPRVYAHGRELGGYDLAWVVMERLPYGPVGSKWGADAFELLADAAANFYASARLIPVVGKARQRDWEGVLKKAREHATPRMLPQSQRWKKALKTASRKLPAWLDVWRGRPMDFWCHGDLHLGNAMTRHKPPHGPAVLFDLANVHVGHWIEDAVYFEHLYWARQSVLNGKKPVNLIAHYMRDFDVSPGEDWPELANVKRALLAMTAPANMDAEGGARHTAAALEMLERYV